MGYYHINIHLCIYYFSKHKELIINEPLLSLVSAIKICYKTTNFPFDYLTIHKNPLHANTLRYNHLISLLSPLYWNINGNYIKKLVSTYHQFFILNYKCFITL